MATFPCKTMNVKQFIQEYGKYIKSYKEYDNGVIMFKFHPKGKSMWLKRMVHEKLDMNVKTSSPHTATYWFK